MRFNAQKTIFKTVAGLSILALAACNNDNNNPVSQEYSISITNITNAQPLSPPVAMLHSSSFSFWKVGTSASIALEVMAEGGDGSDLLKLHPSNPQFRADAALKPGDSITFTLTATSNTLMKLSIAGMLVNTNDAFSGLNSIELMDLEAGQTNVYYTYVYDAGTEFNSELPGTIPGPADSGEGFNADRDDVTSVVTHHGGIVSADDNFSASTLSYADKFDNPTLRIVVTAL